MTHVQKSNEQTLVRTVEVDPDLLALMRQLLADHRASATRRDRNVLDERLWQALNEVGLTRITGSEDRGGSGATWIEAGALLGLGAATAAAVPLAEHDLLAGWALEQAELDHPDAPLTLAMMDRAGVAHGVPWAAQVSTLVAVRDMGAASEVALIKTSDLIVEDGRNHAGEPRATVRIDSSASVAWVQVDRRLGPELHLRGALARAAQLSGALDQIVRLCVEHTTARIQFGRPLAAFQAVQHLIADAAAEAAIARAATDAALAKVAADGFASSDAHLAIAVARSCAGHAASTIVRNAHQVHGAIGSTREHQLHEFTQPVLAWRGEYGSMREWDEYLTRVAVGAGAEVWQVVSGGVPGDHEEDDAAVSGRPAM